MVTQSIPRIHAWFRELLYQPAKIFWICAALAATGVVLDGTAIRLWSLHRDHAMLAERIKAANLASKQLEFRLQEAQRPSYIERQARDQFDLVKEGDLVFVFGSEAEPTER